MKPDSAAPADQQNLLRQQLILAQVRIMELEDERDSLTPRLQEMERLLGQAQTLADRKLDEAAHLEKILTDTRTHSAHLQQLQSQAAQDLAATRAAMTEATATLTQRNETIARLEAELRALHSSRSWRWTVWLRSLGGKP